MSTPHPFSAWPGCAPITDAELRDYAQAMADRCGEPVHVYRRGLYEACMTVGPDPDHPRTPATFVVDPCRGRR